MGDPGGKVVGAQLLACRTQVLSWLPTCSSVALGRPCPGLEGSRSQGVAEMGTNEHMGAALSPSSALVPTGPHQSSVVATTWEWGVWCHTWSPSSPALGEMGPPRRWVWVSGVPGCEQMGRDGATQEVGMSAWGAWL